MADFQVLEKQVFEACRTAGIVDEGYTHISLPILDFDQGRLWAWYFLYNVISDDEIICHQPFMRIAIALDSGEISGMVPIATSPYKPIGEVVLSEIADETWAAFNQSLTGIGMQYQSAMTSDLHCAWASKYFDLFESMIPTVLLPWYLTQNPTFFYWLYALDALAQHHITRFDASVFDMPDVALENLSLSSDELLLLAALVHSPTVMDEQSFFVGPEAFKGQFVQAVDHLLKSDLVRVTDKVAQFSPELAAIARILAQPQQVVMSISLAGEDVLEGHYFSQQASWLCDELISGQSHILNIVELPALLERLKTQLHLNDQVDNPDYKFWMSQTALLNLQRRVATQQDAVRDILQDIPKQNKEMVATFVQALTTSQRNTSIAKFTFESRKLQRQYGGTLMQSGSNLWLLYPHQDEQSQETERVWIETATGARVASWLASLFKDLSS